MIVDYTITLERARAKHKMEDPKTNATKSAEADNG
jgi:hypothetical protein